MYYGDYEEGEFFAEDLNFKDDKKKEFIASPQKPKDINIFNRAVHQDGIIISQNSDDTTAAPSSM